jgi:O-antigen/teichoic acid export membrane protein
MNHSFSRNALANLIQMILSAALLFVLYRFLNKTLGVAGLGIWSVVLSTASASRFADLGLSQGVTRFVAWHQARKEPEIAAKFIETGIVSIIVICGVLLMLINTPIHLILPHFFKPDVLPKAFEIIPYSLVSVLLTMAGAVIQSGFDGCQRMDLRALLVVIGQGLMLLLAFELVPKYGLVGLALSQIGQGIFLLIAGWIGLRTVIVDLPWMPWRWNRDIFKELYAYGANMQAASVFILMFDPITKGFLAKFSGVSAVGYFEMANQVVIKVRALIVVANQAIVPEVAVLSETNPKRLISLYIENVRALIFISLPVFALLIASEGIIFKMLNGQNEQVFYFLIQCNAIGWLINTVGSPAYFFNLGTGRLGFNTVSHIIMTSVNACLGYMMGRWFGLDGVVFAYVASLMAGSMYLVITFQLNSGISWRALMLNEYLFVILASALLIAIRYIDPWLLTFGEYAHVLIRYLLPSILLGVALWRHSVFGVIRDYVKTSLNVKM